MYCNYNILKEEIGCKNVEIADLKIKKEEEVLKLNTLIEKLNENETPDLLQEIADLEKLIEYFDNELKKQQDLLNQLEKNILPFNMLFNKINSDDKIKNLFKRYLINKTAKDLLDIQVILKDIDIIKSTIFKTSPYSNLSYFNENDNFLKIDKIIGKIIEHIDFKTDINIDKLNDDLDAVRKKVYLAEYKFNNVEFETDSEIETSKNEIGVTKELYRTLNSRKNKKLKEEKASIKARLIQELGLDI